MNDRFRFRVWNEEEKIFEEINFNRTDGFFISQDGKLFEITRLDYDSSYIDERPDLIKEFCTGLKDKNGKLIYEGDVVEAVVQNHYKLKGIICWEIDRYQIKDLNAPVLFDLYEALYDSDTGFEKNTIEVIGNIHENPELLEK